MSPKSIWWQFWPRRATNTNSNSIHYTTTANRSYKQRIYEPTPPSQVYFSQGKRYDTGSQFSTASNSNPYQQDHSNHLDHYHTYYSTRDNYYISYNNQNQDTNDTDYLPEVTMVIKTMNVTKVPLFGLCLFDTCSTCTLINKHAILHYVQLRKGPN